MDAGTAEKEWREDCAPRRVLKLFAIKWTSMVLHTLHAQHAGRRALADQLVAAQFTLDFHLSSLVHAVNLEHGLGGIQACSRRAAPLLQVLTTRTLAHRCRWGRPPIFSVPLSRTGRIVVAHALAHADYRKQLAALLRKEVTGNGDLAVIGELLA